MPPYSLERIRSAYRRESKRLHPDRGGETAQFVDLRRSYEQALQFVSDEGAARFARNGSSRRCGRPLRRRSGRARRFGGAIGAFGCVLLAGLAAFRAP